MHLHHHLRLLTSALCLLTSGLLAQQLPQPEITGTATTTERQLPIENRESKIQNSGDDEVVTMSVFNVSGSKDDGYQALNTTSGSRLNTALKDTAASVSAFTPEFLDDIGATTIDDMLTYAGNAEMDTDDANSNFNDTTGRSDDANNSFRIRGIGGSITRDYVDTGVPMDLYNVDRAEIASGANSILFGMGSQGGILTLNSQSANLQRNTLRIQNTISLWDNRRSTLGTNRTNLNYNIVLMPRILAFRLAGLYENSESWRYWQSTRQKRLNPMLTIRPWKNTTIKLSYEAGTQERSTTRQQNASDSLTGWLANPPDQRVMQGFGAAYALPNTTTIAGAAVDNYVLFDNNNQLYNVRQAYQSTDKYGGYGNASTLGDQTLLPPNLSSFDYSTVGPGGMRTFRFQDWSAIVEQTLGPVNFQLSYHHNRTDGTVLSESGNDDYLIGDPNAYLSPVQWVGATNVVPNPYAGGIYMEGNWFKNLSTITNDSIRLTTEYSLNLGKFGRHRLVNLLEHSSNERLTSRNNQILLDQNQRAISNDASPEAGANRLTRRQYVTEGDFRTYYSGDPRIDVPDFSIGDRTFHTAYAAANNQQTHILRDADTLMLALQSYFFNDALVTTLGGRIDYVKSKREMITRVAPDDPRVLDGTKAVNELTLGGKWRDPKNFTPGTFSAGAVWHLTNRFSVFADYSTNRATPYLDGRTVLPDGNTPPLSKGTTSDYGVMFDLAGNNKWLLRLTRYDTKQLNDASIMPTGVGDGIDQTLGSTNLYNIFDALYFLTPTLLGTQTTTWAPGTGPNAGPGRDGNQWNWKYAVTPPDTAYTYGRPPLYTSTLCDVVAQGYEAELTGNPTQNITLRLTFSYTARERERMFSELIDYYNKNIPIWLAMARQIDPATGNLYTVTLNDGSMQPLDQYIWNQIFSNANVPNGNGAGGAGPSVRTGLLRQMMRYGGPLGSRPWKANLVATYKFTDGSLKGFKLGGSVKYQSANLMPDPTRVATISSVDPGTTQLDLAQDAFDNPKLMMKGNSMLTYGLIASYKCKVFGGRTNLTVQLNINNLFNQCVVLPGRYTMVGGDMLLRRVYLNNPRSFQLTTTLDF